MLRLAIGRALLWLIEPAEAERDQPIRERSALRRIAYEKNLERTRPEREASAAGFHAADLKLKEKLSQRLVNPNSRSASDNLV